MNEHLTNLIAFSQEEKTSLSAQSPAHAPGFAGLDEAGRGCLAGPVTAACVWLPDGCSSGALEGLTDSKQMCEALREKLEPRIKDAALAWGLGFVWPEEIDQINILQASLKAMALACAAMLEKNSREERFGDFALPAGLQGLLIDGNQIIPTFLLHNAFSDVNPNAKFVLPQQSVVRGDSRILAIAAASVLAKAERDRVMREAARTYPEYGFERHKGYGTKEHLEALALYGACPLHRLSFQGCGVKPKGRIRNGIGKQDQQTLF